MMPKYGEYVVASYAVFVLINLYSIRSVEI